MLRVLLTMCATVSGQTECRVVEVPVTTTDRSVCAVAAEAEANDALNLALLFGIPVDMVSARCVGQPA